MAKKLYVGNLSYGTTDSDLQSMFEEFGTVQSAQVIMDRESGRSKGFGFVEMGSDQEAQAAINALNGKDMDGRAFTVNEAKPREDRGWWRPRRLWRRRRWRKVGRRPTLLEETFSLTIVALSKPCCLGRAIVLSHCVMLWEIAGADAGASRKPESRVTVRRLSEPSTHRRRAGKPVVQGGCFTVEPQRTPTHRLPDRLRRAR